MDGLEYATLLGKLVMNLQTLEFALRVYLYNQAHSALPLPKNLLLLKIGETVPANEVTDYCTLAQLIDRYNRTIPDPQLEVDRSVVGIRNAMAHGRVFGALPQPPFTLLKFGRVKNGKTKVKSLPNGG